MGTACVMTASPNDDNASAERRIQELTKELSQAKGELAYVTGRMVHALQYSGIYCVAE